MHKIYQTVKLMDRSRLRQQGKSKEAQVCRVKQIEPDDSKHKLMDQSRQDSEKRSSGFQSKLKTQMTQNRQNSSPDSAQIQAVGTKRSTKDLEEVAQCVCMCAQRVRTKDTMCACVG